MSDDALEAAVALYMSANTTAPPGTGALIQSARAAFVALRDDLARVTGAHTEAVRDLDTLRVAVERMKDERDGWRDIAAQENRNAEYYRGLLDKTATVFGQEAFVSDDGLVQDSVLRAKVPDMAAGLVQERDAAVAALRVILGLRARLEDMENLICAAAPLAWAHGVNVDHAHEWEKQAKALVEAAMKADGR